MKQEEYLGFGSIKHVESILKNNNAKNIFLVTGNGSYESCGSKEVISKLLSNYSFSRFCDFEVDPKVEDVKRGIDIFRKGNYDMVIAIGGGSVMDTAKLINILSPQSGNPVEYIQEGREIEPLGKPLIAIPTTAGSGSEATHFAVVYVDGKKYSVAHPDMLSNHAILDPSLTIRLPQKITASTGMDALTQASESLWSVGSTDESQKYAREAINLVLNNLNNAVNNPSLESREAMINAAHLAGMAINITKTTAPHALSYYLTSKYGIPHGHAVALTFGEVLVHNSLVTEEDVIDERGAHHVRNTMQELYGLLGCTDANSSRERIKDLMDSIDLEISLSQFGITKEDIGLILGSVNLERLKNNPRKLTVESMRELLLGIL
jgi:alcohol dehydrogenase class IV|tara:strand:- start:44702 stop:45835 length:1134 start_codon:yes stop_codon:yes gene_type:complete